MIRRICPSLRRSLGGLLLTSLLAAPAQAHFQELIPDSDIVSNPAQRQLGLSLTFTHPMSGGPAMAMAKPKRFAVMAGEEQIDLLESLETTQVDNQPSYKASYSIRRPGDHTFFVEPAPYWEPAEGKMIVHYTKVTVDGFGGEPNWQQDLGLPVEITPLVRPYGLWSGNLFRGIVKKDSKPVPFAEIEVEWRNDGSLTAPADAYVTQVIQANANGEFSYAMPKAGWWGFAALVDADEPMTNPDGKQVPVELGGLIWVYTRDMK